MNNKTRKKTSPRVLIIGFDGATFDLIRPWISQGYLPTFKKIMGQGAWGELEVEIPPGTVPNWPSFATGKNPGKHGLIWWVKPDPQRDDYSLVSSSDLRGDTIWDIAGYHGLNVGIVNVPVTYPPHPVNGFIISGLLTPPNAVNFAYPSDLLGEIKEAVGDYRVFPKEHHRKGNEQNYLDDILKTMDIRRRAVHYLLENKPWDLFCVVFGATDWAMHAYWKYHDQNHPFHDPEEAKYFGNALLTVYQKADHALQKLLETVDENTHVIIMSDHGAGPGVGKSLINNWLLEKGLLKIQPTPISQLKFLLWRWGFTVENIFPLVSRMGLMKFKRKIDPRRTGRKNIVRRVFLSYNDIDWSRTKAFTIGGMGQIHINLKGRHPLGCVEPGEEYESLCGYISEHIKEIKLPDSEEPFVKRVYRKGELFHGDHLEDMPDLILMPSDMRYLDSGIEFASNNLFLKVDAVSGAHRTNGVFIFQSPDGLNKDNLKGISIRDITPTVLYLLNIPIPEDIDGRVITKIINEEYLSDHPIQSMRTSEKDSIKREIGYASDIDEEMVRQRLADLGYLD